MTFAADFQWSRRFIPQQAEILAGVLRVTVASWDDDRLRNTDLHVATLANGTRCTCRVRRHEYAPRFRSDFTVRTSRRSGARTELAKLRYGYGDFGIYGFESEPGSDRMLPWVLYNAALLREYLDGGGRWAERTNVDQASAFACFDLAEMPPGFILNSDGHGSRLDTTPPYVPCRYCGRPCWTDDAHACCRLYGDACPACRASDSASHYRYGWPA